MTYTLNLDPSSKYIVVKITGDTTRNNAFDHVVAAHTLGKELRIRCYLVDVTESRNVESIVGNYKFAADDATTSPAIDPGACNALLVAPGDHSFDFVVTLTQNAGLDVELFGDREIAIAHLLKADEHLGPRPDSN